MAMPMPHSKDTAPATVIVLDLENKEPAIEAAKKFVAITGRAVTIRDEKGVEIETIYPTQN